MPTHLPPRRPQAKVRTRSLDQRFARAYGRACHRLFGKTLSVMVGEAQARGAWYGSPCCMVISLLLRDPGHCAKELRLWRKFLSGQALFCTPETARPHPAAPTRLPLAGRLRHATPLQTRDDAESLQAS